MQSREERHDVHAISVDTDDPEATGLNVADYLHESNQRGQLVAVVPETKDGTTLRFWFFFRPR